MEIDIAKYLTEDQMTDIVKDAVADMVRRETQYTNLKTILGNTAYEVVKTICEKDLGEDAKRIIAEKVDSIAANESSLKFVLFYEPSHYGNSFNERKGIALQIAEDYVRAKCVEKIQGTVDKILNSMKFNTKKFEQMVLKEAAKMVAEKMTSNIKS